MGKIIWEGVGHVITESGCVALRALKQGSTLRCLAPFVLFAIAGFSLNASVYSYVSSYCGIAREIATFANAVAFLALFGVSEAKPAFIDKRLLTTVAVGCLLTAAVALEFGLALQVPWATIVGLVCSSVASAWAATLIACAVTALPTAGVALASVAAGMAFGEVAVVVHPTLQYNIGTAEVLLCYALVITIAYPRAGALLGEISSSEAPASLELSNPESFLHPSHGLFTCVLLFSIATGYGLTLGEVDNAPASFDISAPMVVLAALWMMLSKSREREDTLFSFCVLLVVGGFIIAPFTFFNDLSSANTLIRIGVRCFEMLVWFVVIAVGRRNPLALLPTFGLVRSLHALGTDVGAVVGHTTNNFVGTNAETAAMIAACVLFLFVALMWVGFRKFSFSAAIRGIVSVGEAAHGAASSEQGAAGDGSAAGEATCGSGVSEADMGEAPLAEGEGAAPVPGGDPPRATIEERCRVIGQVHGLTEREIEIFAFLARGRNGQFLMDHYVVSRNTVKSHIKHIYAKLGVHSQQELIDCVERGE